MRHDSGCELGRAYVGGCRCAWRAWLRDPLPAADLDVAAAREEPLLAPPVAAVWGYATS